MNRSAKIALVFLLALAVGAWVLSAARPPTATSQAAESAEPARTVPVIITPARAMRFERTLAVVGTVEARNYALVSPRIPGPLDAIYVDEGDRVEAGKTRLFQTDALKLQKAVEIARQQHAVARCAVLEKRANLERVAADTRKAELDFGRAKELFAKTVISKSAYDADESTYLQAAAAQKHAQVLIDLAVEQEKQARLALEIAQKDLP